MGSFLFCLAVFLTCYVSIFHRIDLILKYLAWKLAAAIDHQAASYWWGHVGDLTVPCLLCHTAVCGGGSELRCAWAHQSLWTRMCSALSHSGSRMVCSPPQVGSRSLRKAWSLGVSVPCSMLSAIFARKPGLYFLCTC